MVVGIKERLTIHVQYQIHSNKAVSACVGTILYIYRIQYHNKDNEAL